MNKRDSAIRILLLLAAVAFCAALVWLYITWPTPPAPAATVATAEPIGGTLTLQRESYRQEVRRPARVEDGSRVQTEASRHAWLRLDNGAFVLLGDKTDLTVHLNKLILRSGRVWVDTSAAEETELGTAHGQLGAQGASFAVAAASEEAVEVYCGSGEVTYRAEKKGGSIQQGESLLLSSAGARVKPEGLWDDWTGGLAVPQGTLQREVRTVGDLAGRLVTDSGKARLPLPVRAHQVSTAIDGDFAVTEVTQSFFNARSEVLEAEYAVRIPDGATVAAFAVDTGSGFQQASIGVLEMAEDGEPRFDDPSTEGSVLTYQAPGRLRARVYPVNAGATVRVRLRYTEWLQRQGDRRTYVYPMGDGGEPPLLSEFTLEVKVSDAATGAFRAGMGASVEGSRVVLRRSDFRPRADFYLDLIDSATGSQRYELTSGKAYLVDAPPGDSRDDAPFVHFDLPLEAIETSSEQPPLSLVLLVDMSGGIEPENIELSGAVVESVLRQLSDQDEVLLRIADLTVHPPAALAEDEALSGWVRADSKGRERLLQALARETPAGATDLAEVLRQAAVLASGKPRAAVLYLGDGIASAGALDAGGIGRALAAVQPAPPVFALAVGDGANLDLLHAVLGDRAQPVREIIEASHAVMRVLARASRPTLTQVRADLGHNVERIYPSMPLSLADGQRLRVTGRLKGDLPDSVEVSGMVNGEPFDLKVPVDGASLDDQGDLRRRWGRARLFELLDGDACREALVELGLRYQVLTPYTPLVVGASPGTPFRPVRGFHGDPRHTAWHLGGRGSALATEGLGASRSPWLRTGRAEAREYLGAPERTWEKRSLPETASPAATASDGGLRELSVRNTLRLHQRGPRGCYDREARIRPDLSGDIEVNVKVDGDGSVSSAVVSESTIGSPEVESCVREEVLGLPFPATGARGSVSANYRYSFTVSERAIGTRRRCSSASKLPLAGRAALWQERLDANSGVSGALNVWREARRQCEVGNFRARRTLLRAMLVSVGSLSGKVQLYKAFDPDSDTAAYLARIIMRSVRTARDVSVVRAGLALNLSVQWPVFLRQWKQQTDPQKRLKLVRTWLAVVPDDMDLRVRLLSLLEQTGRLSEARRLARELRADPMADSQVRTVVGEFFLRQGDRAFGRRIFSEIVEYAPLDPWARRRLGDLYRAHGFYQDAYGEYQTLNRLRPDDSSVLLLLARAAAGAGRLDEALGLQQRLSQSVGDDTPVTPGCALHPFDPSLSTFARLWTTVLLKGLRLQTQDKQRLEAISDRERRTGVLREPPALFAAVTWPHPDDRVALFFQTEPKGEAERAPQQGAAHGIEAFQLRHQEGMARFVEVKRTNDAPLRTTEAHIWIVREVATERETISRTRVKLDQKKPGRRYALQEDGQLEEVPLRKKATTEPLFAVR